MRVGAAWVALLALVSVAVLVPNHPATHDPAEDSGVFFYAAQRLLDGGAPYRDIWDHKPPGVYVIDAVGLALARQTGVWIVQVVFLIAAAVLGYVALRREFGGTAGIVGSLAWLITFPRLFLEYGQTSFVEFYALPLQFGALLLYTRRLSSSRAIAIGALGGAAFLLKPTLVGIWLAIGVLEVVRRRRSAIRPLVLVALGVVVPLAMVVAWAFARGVLGEMVDQALTYNRAYAAFASISERVDAVLSGLRLTLPSGLALIAAGTWTYAVITRRLRSNLLSVALVAFPMEIVLSTWGRGYHYYFIAWLPSMGVLAAFATSEVQRLVKPRIVRPALVLVVFAMSVLPALFVIRLATSTYEVRARRAAEYVVANTKADDTVLIWGSHSEVLFLAGRQSPTRYVYQYAALATRGYATGDRVDEFLADLVRARPVLIIDASSESFATPPLDLTGFRAWSSPERQYAALPELERVIEYITANYDHAGAEPTTGWPLWRLRSP